MSYNQDASSGQRVLGRRIDTDDNRLHMTMSRPFAVALLALLTVSGCASTARVPEAVPHTPQVSETRRAIADALTLEGRDLQQQGMSEEALAAFSKAIEENPMLTEAHLGMGDVFREQAAYENASASYREAIITNPDNFDARYFYGLTNQLRGMLDRAIASYQRALVIDPDSFLANRDMGSAQLQAGRPNEAIPYAQKAVEIDAESQGAWANLAAAYSLSGDYTGAVDAYRQTLELGDPVEQILFGLADAHIHLGNYQRAENVLKASLRSDVSPIAYERLGFVLFKQGRYGDALAAYREALVSAPRDTTSLNGTGVCLMAMYLQGDEDDESLRHAAMRAWRESLAVDRDQSNLIDLIARYSKE